MKVIDNFLREDVSEKLKNQGEEILSYYSDGYFKRGIVTLATYLYRKNKEECKEKCEGDDNKMACRYRCYISACQDVLNTLNSTVRPVIDDIEDDDQREKQQRIFEGQIEKFTNKMTEFKNKAESAEQKSE